MFRVLADSDGILCPCSSPWFSFPITSYSPFSFIWSSYTCLSVISTRVMVLSFFTMVCQFLTPSWIAFLLYYHGLPIKMWLPCIGIISHITSSTIFPIKNRTTTCLVTFTSSLSFSHCNSIRSSMLNSTQI